MFTYIGVYVYKWIWYISYLHIQMNMNVYINEYVNMLASKDKYVCVYIHIQINQCVQEETDK
jgi:hypothetical protein